MAGKQPSLCRGQRAGVRTTGSVSMVPKMMGVALVTARPTKEKAAMKKGSPSACPAVLLPQACCEGLGGACRPHSNSTHPGSELSATWHICSQEAVSGNVAAHLVLAVGACKRGELGMSP